MTAKFEKINTNEVVLTFEISEELIKQGLEVAFNRVKKNLNVPGFRKGKVSRQVFNKMYGEEALYQDALNYLLPDAYDNAVEETGIFPVTQPKIDIESLEKGQPWVIKATVIVKPEVKLGEYKGLTIDVKYSSLRNNSKAPHRQWGIRCKGDRDFIVAFLEREPNSELDDPIILIIPYGMLSFLAENTLHFFENNEIFLTYQVLPEQLREILEEYASLKEQGLI